LTCGASSSSPSDSQFPPHRRTSEHRQELKDADPGVSQEEAPFTTGTAVATAGGGNFPPIKESGHMYEEESELYPKRVLSLSPTMEPQRQSFKQEDSFPWVQELQQRSFHGMLNNVFLSSGKMENKVGTKAKLQQKLFLANRNSQFHQQDSKGTS
jgi:hypothetical protein